MAILVFFLEKWPPDNPKRSKVNFDGIFGGPMVGPPSEDLEILLCKNLIFGHFQVSI